MMSIDHTGYNHLQWRQLEPPRSVNHRLGHHNQVRTSQVRTPHLADDPRLALKIQALTTFLALTCLPVFQRPASLVSTYAAIRQ
jgi:hypothetical protein